MNTPVPDQPNSTPDPSTVDADPTAPDVSDPSISDPVSAPGETAPIASDLAPGLQQLVDVAVADLAERRGLDDPSAVVVVSVEEVVWPDRSLGCPRKGMQYAQVLTDGTRIVLEVDGTRYSYHGGNGVDPTYCPNPQPPVESAGA